MKHFNYAILILSSLLIFASCKEKSRVDKMEEFRSELNQQDTLTMLKLCDDCMNSLKAGKIDQVIASLYEYNDTTEEVTPLTPATEKSYRKKFKIFPVLDFERVSYSFQLEGCNDVKYKVKFAESDNVEETGEFKTMYMFNPVKIDGTWYLTVKRPGQDFDTNM